MIILEIDGQPVALSSDFSLDFYDYNGLFDVEKKRGAFTYDINIDLHQGDNARLYHHFNRINNISKFTDRNARLIVSGIVFAQGKEVILECNGDIAKIQIVCGSSEVNAAEENKRIGVLDLGTLPNYTPEEALTSLHVELLTWPAVCTPVLVDYVKMPWVSKASETATVGKMVNLAEYTDLWSEWGSWHNNTRFIGQPYLVIVVERVLQALGWNVTYNILRQMEYAKRLIVVHGIETCNICEMLPNWTASEFLSQIELMFNVIIVYNQTERKASIHDRNTFYNSSANVINIDNEDLVIDENTPARKFESEEKYFYNYDFVKYDLPSDVYGYRADISDDVNGIVSLWYVNEFSEFNAPGSDARVNHYNEAIFFFHVPSGTKWMLTELGKNIQATIRRSFVRVDHFCHVKKSSYKEGETTETVLKIVPAETLVMSINTTDPTVNCGVVIPYAKMSGKIGADFSTTETMGLNQWVEGNAPRKKDTSSEKLYVAQYLGRTSVLAGTHPDNYATARYPQVFTHRYIDGRIHSSQYLDQWAGNWRDSIFDALWDKGSLENDITFDLKKRLDTTYKNSILVNDKEIYIINIKIRARLNVTSIFNIVGRKFVCVSLQYQVRNGKLLPYAIGTFLPML